MDRIAIKKLVVLFFIANMIAIGSCVISGYLRGNIAFRFEEKQAITFFSSNQLAATSLLAWLIYVLRTRLLRRGQATRDTPRFWVISAMGFFYLMLDESFQFHEGMDTSLFRMFGHNENPMLDGVVTALYGLAAAAVCYYHRAEILRYRSTLALFCLGGFFLAVTSVLDIGEETKAQIVVEESMKLLGVTSFLLGHFAAFLGTLRDIQSDLSESGWMLSGESLSGEFTSVETL
jgi:hypothetical protein